MESLWTKSCQMDKRETLCGNKETEIAVIGGGMAGILTAYQLQKAGRQVLVLEARRTASGQTGNTTAKITSQHGLCYHQFLKKYGETKASQYALANERALLEFRTIIARESIECDFEEQSSFVYSKSSASLQEETEAAVRIGLPASFVQDGLTLPFPVYGAVKFDHQAQFHPLKFINAISKDLQIYENTLVQRVDGQKITTNSGIVRADKIVFACHYPFLNLPGLYLLRLHQSRSYVLALENAMETNGMYIGESAAGYSFRNYGPYLLFGGQGHRTGEKSHIEKYEQLRKDAKKFFPKSKEIGCWSAQDCMTPDHIPYIGQYSGNKPDWYIATGFQKWGMTTSMAASLILRDMICGKNNDFAEVFSPQRFPAQNIPFILKESGHSIKGLSKGLLGSQKKAGADTRCPHLGCQLEWNPDEHSWDCPCHGSRFDDKGKLLNGPAQINLKKNSEADS